MQHAAVPTRREAGENKVKEYISLAATGQACVAAMWVVN